MAAMACPICEKRKPKRFCPAKQERICPRCCGEHREVTITCPLDCRYLQDSRERDYGGGLDPKDFPYKEIEIDAPFLREHGELVETCGREVLQGSLAVAGAVDSDTREALDGLIRTYKTRETGLYYDSRPDSVFAARIFEHLQETLERFLQQEREQSGFTRTHDTDVMKTLVFLLRMALDRNNGRAKGRAFLDFLQLHFGQPEAAESSLLVPGGQQPTP